MTMPEVNLRISPRQTSAFVGPRQILWWSGRVAVEVFVVSGTCRRYLVAAVLRYLAGQLRGGRRNKDGVMVHT